MTAKESALNLRKTNFIFGSEPRHFESNYQELFNPEIPINYYFNDNQTAKDVRKTNIRLQDNHPNDKKYISTQKDDYVPIESKPFTLDKVQYLFRIKSTKFVPLTPSLASTARNIITPNMLTNSYKRISVIP